MWWIGRERERPLLWLIHSLSLLLSQSLKGKGLRDCSAVQNYHILSLAFSEFLFICALELSSAV